MAIDHSKTYRTRSFRNLFHRHRLKTLRHYLSKLVTENPSMYFDVGCSNGYLTNIINDAIKADQCLGLDHSVENVANAKSTYKNLEFGVIDLNVVLDETLKGKADVVTCLETLEHVGDIGVSVENLKDMLATKGVLIITVPVETGFIGLLKFLLKTGLYRYDLKEIGIDSPGKFTKYLSDLMLNKRIDGYRVPKAGWSTHFGFDYRAVQAHCEANFKQVDSQRRGTTRFISCRESRTLF